MCSVVVTAGTALLVATTPATAAGAATITIRVPHDYASIQAAVDAAAPGDTIAVAGGTYTEEVVIDKDVQLRGAGVDATVIKAPATLTPYGVHHPDGRLLTAIVRIGHAARVQMSRLTISGPIPCSVEVSGVHALQGATLDLVDARVTRIQADPTTCPADDAAGRAVVYGTPPHIDVDGVEGTTAFGRVSHVRIDHYQHAGVSIAAAADGTPSRVQVSDNVIVGGWTLPSFQVGIWIEDSAVVDVTGNTINGNRCGGFGCGPDPINEGQGLGVFTLGVPPGTRITDNHLARNDTAINAIASPDCCLISHNTLRQNSFFGIVIQDGDGRTYANTIVGGRVGEAVVADAVDTTGVFRFDRIQGTTLAPVREIECCGYTATAVVKP
jgi:nitrous oxidase accessory protein NosD